MRKKAVLSIAAWGLLAVVMSPVAVAAPPTTETIHYEDEFTEMDVVCTGP